MNRYFAALALALQIRAAPESDRVTDIPGLNHAPSFATFSRYLDASSTHHLHYVFTEARDPKPDTPLLVWFNGGPGCSSLLGLFTENGPFRIKPDSSEPGPVITEFDQSWTSLAHMLFIESPVGVGYSYSDTFDTDTISDETTALDAHSALGDFFKKFPEHSVRKFLLSGESYGGIYIPTLGALVDADNELTGRFLGVIIGNGMYNWKDNQNSMPFFAYYHGLLGFNQWKKLIGDCCVDSVADEENCDFDGGVGACAEEFQTVQTDVWAHGLSPYNLYGPCHHGKAVYMRLTQTVQDPPCVDDSGVSAYINSGAFKDAFHIETDVKWEMCSMPVMSKYEMTVKDTAKYFDLILSKPHRKVTLYSGDVDMACNFLGTQWFLHRLAKKLGYYETADYRQWHVNDQVAGYAKDWANIGGGQSIHLRTIRGAGHMVPTDKPDEALHLLRVHLGMGHDKFTWDNVDNNSLKL